MGNAPRRKSKAGTRTTAPSTRTKTAAPVPNPWPKRLAYIGGVAVVALILAAILFGGGDEIQDIAFDGVPSGPPEGVETFQGVDRQHVDGDIDYGTPNPPGGIHNPIWQNCGFYAGPVRTENVVHSMEHGVVWIGYRSDVGDGNLEDIRQLARQREFRIVASEVPDQDGPVVLVSWGARLSLPEYDDIAVRQFIREFHNSPAAPEPGASCAGGVGSPA